MMVFVVPTLLILSSVWRPFVKSVSVCEYKKCRPGCICDIRFDDQCATEYGNYGWTIPSDASANLYRYMRPDVSEFLLVWF